MTPCCPNHPDACPMCKRPWDQPEDADGLECWTCGRMTALESDPPDTIGDRVRIGGALDQYRDLR